VWRHLNDVLIFFSVYLTLEWQTLSDFNKHLHQLISRHIIREKKHWLNYTCTSKLKRYSNVFTWKQVIGYQIHLNIWYYNVLHLTEYTVIVLVEYTYLSQLVYFHHYVCTGVSELSTHYIMLVGILLILSYV